MISRREILIGAAAAGTAALIRGGTPVFAKAAQPTTPVNFDVPAGACDCHTHLFGDPRRYPLAIPRTYTAEPVSVPEMQAMHRALHIDRVVVVTPSLYGTDNSCTRDGLKQLGPSARGIAVIDEHTPRAALDELDHAGFRGIRVNLETTRISDLAVASRSFTTAVESLKSRGNWHMQINTRLSVIEGIKDLLMTAPMPLVFDHFGSAQARLGVGQPGFDALLELVRSGKAYVKISAAYRASTLAPDYPDVAPLAKALIAANPQRILWGTDWPHSNARPPAGVKFSDITPLFQIDDGRVLNQLPVWAPDAALRKTILVDNPARLFGF